MKRWKRSILALLALLLLASFSAVNVVSAEKAVIVSEVRGLYDYVPTDNTFTRGSTLKVYTEMSGVNYNDFVLVDFVFAITDTTMRDVDLIERRNVRRRDHNNTVYVEYTVDIPSWMAYGEHTIKIAAYDRLEKSQIDILDRKLLWPRNLETIMDTLDEYEYGHDQHYGYDQLFGSGQRYDSDQLFGSGQRYGYDQLFGSDQRQRSPYYYIEFRDIENLYANVCNGDEYELRDLGVLKDFEDSRREISYLKFFVCREEAKKGMEEMEQKISPESKFSVTDFRMSPSTVKPNETVSISVTVKNGGWRGTEKIALALNDKIEFVESVTLDYKGSKTLFYQVKKDIPGQYKVSVPGTDLVKQLFVEERYGEEVTETPTYSFSAMKMPESGGALALAYLPVTSLLSHQLLPYP